MSEAGTPTDEAPQGAPATIHDPLAETFPATLEGKVLFGIAIVFSTFQLLTAAGLLGLPSQVVRSVHVGFLTLLVFPLLASLRQARPSTRVIAWALGASGFSQPPSTGSRDGSTARAPPTCEASHRPL